MRKFFSLSIVLLSLSSLAFANFQAGQRYFAQRDYVRAAGAFYQAYSFARSIDEKSASEWYLAESLKAVGMLYASSKFYSQIVLRGPRRSNRFFRQALQELGRINEVLSLGPTHMMSLVSKDVDPTLIPGPARGFYFYYKGLKDFTERRYERAGRWFRRVPENSRYYLRALFHMGVIANRSGQNERAISYYEKILRVTGGRDEWIDMSEASTMNIARILYEKRRYREAIRFYGQVPRESYFWLNALWESSWAFFMTQNYNEALGNIHTIHSPFFIHKFFPESFILQAIIFLKLCRYQDVLSSLKLYKRRYMPVSRSLRSLLGRYKGNYSSFFKLVYDYDAGSLRSHESLFPILDELTQTNIYREANDTIRFSDKERRRLDRFASYWGGTGLADEINNFLNSKKSAARIGGGKRLYQMAVRHYRMLQDLTEQIDLIQAEVLEGKVNELRRKASIATQKKTVNYVGGLQELKVGQRYEYWPFEGEYWEDELGYYVYNIGSRCARQNKK